MTQLLHPTDFNVHNNLNMAHSTSLSTSHSTSTSDNNPLVAVELPRYRGRKSADTKHSLDTKDAVETEEEVRRYDSFDSTFTNDIDGVKLQYSSTAGSTLGSTTSLLEKPVVRTLVFRRHWFHTDMSVYSVHPSTTTSVAADSGGGGAPEVMSTSTPFALASSSTPTSTSSAQANPTSADSQPGIPVYHLATYEFNVYQPDIIMYAGAQPSAAHVLAVSHFRWSRNARMAFGSEALDDKSPNLAWEELRNTSKYLLHGTYEFSVPTTHSSGSGSGSVNERRHFRLQRTHAAADGVVGWAGWMSMRNYRLIDMEAHETVGVFLADNLRSLTKKGELRLFRALGKEVEVGVVLALGSVSEKATRRERHSKHGGGGG